MKILINAYADLLLVLSPQWIRWINEAFVGNIGWISGKEKDKVFNEAAIYCLPSWGEGFSMGGDAIAYGVTVVTTPVGGISDIIRNGQEAIIYDTFDIEKLS